MQIRDINKAKNGDVSFAFYGDDSTDYVNGVTLYRDYSGFEFTVRTFRGLSEIQEYLFEILRNRNQIFEVTGYDINRLI